MYNCNIVLESDVQKKAELIYCGILMGLFSPSSANSYLKWRIIHNLELNQEEAELLLIEPTVEEIDLVFKKSYGDITNETKRLLRYIILNDLTKRYENFELLENIEMVYSSFDYPIDMESFIYYMPNKKYNSCEMLTIAFLEFMNEEKTYLNSHNLL